jgi:hypothetical protein
VKASNWHGEEFHSEVLVVAGSSPQNKPLKEQIEMKLSKVAMTIFGAALLFSTSALAGGTKGTLRLDKDVTVDGTPVKAGNYTVDWTGSGADVQVTLHKGNQTVATFPAHVTQQPAAASSDAYEAASQPNGGNALTAIYFNGKHYVLQVAPISAQSTQGNPSAAK